MSWWQKVARVFQAPKPSATRITGGDATILRPRIFREPFQEKDVAVITGHGKLFKLTRPLTSGSVVNLSKGHVTHDSILSKFPGDSIVTSSGNRCRVEEISLADYIRHSRRIVTPIYPDDAEKIVSRLDITASPVLPNSNEPQLLEVLEAGTGHGALTLYLSKAVSALNGPFPLDAAGYESWRSQRRAIIHSIDVSAKHSKHARKVVDEFRRGIYSHNIDFHVGSAGDWAAQRMAQSGSRPFLAHAFLDLPSPGSHLAAVASAILPTGKLMVFAPSITTILECCHEIKDAQLDMWHSSTVEFGNNGSTGGREWDIRQVIPRKTQARAAEVASEDNSEAEVESSEPSEGETVGATTEEPEHESSDLKWVCRPRVGDRINGGGFLGIFVKKVM